jgi:hypothetical protein
MLWQPHVRCQFVRIHSRYAGCLFHAPLRCELHLEHCVAPYVNSNQAFLWRMLVVINRL